MLIATYLFLLEFLWLSPTPSWQHMARGIIRAHIRLQSFI